MADVVIKIASVDRTANVVFATAEFVSAVNGTVGSCKFRVRDEDRTLDFETGSIIELLVDGSPVWTGYLQSQSRVYAFPAENVDAAGLTRWLDLVGADLNILFTKRIVFNPDDGAKVLMPPTGDGYAAHTPDTTAIADLVGTYLDLSGDDLDVSTLVENVGDINEDQPARPFSGGNTFGQAMQSIASLPGAVYFLSPARFLVYTDANTATAPFGLSDQPDGVTSVGYREMVIGYDASSMANDVLAWGLGYGSNNPVFDREQDATSLATHGRWQSGQLVSGVYKQATIDRIATSILDGSPENLRGAKDDKVSVTCVTYVPGFLPAQKVDFASNVFGFEDVVPIRRMRVTFDAPDTPKFELTLSHEIDAPFNFFDQYLLKLPPLPPLPSFGGFQFGPCGDGNVIASFGNWSVGAPWTNGSSHENATVAFSTTGTVGRSTSTVTANGTATAGATGTLDLSYRQPFLAGEFEASVEFEIIGTGLPVVLNFLRAFLSVSYGGTSVGPILIQCRLGSNGTGNPILELFGGGTAGSLTLPSSPATPPMADTQTWVIKIAASRSANTLTAKAWLLGQTEPSWQISIALSTTQPSNMGVGIQLQLGAQQTWNSGLAGQSSVVGWTDLFYNCTLDSLPVTLPQGACGLPGDSITEVPQWLGGAVVQTRCAYQPNSLTVRRNGLYQRPFTDYAQTDSTGGLVTFSDTLGIADKVEITYLSQGSASS